MPRVSEAYKQERRNVILDAARACFAQQGFQRTTLQDIFAATGLSAGAVYNYFQSKQDLVLAIAETRHDEERAALSVDEADPIAALKEITRRFLSAYLVDSDDRKRRISLITWSEALFDEAIRQSVKEGVDVPRRALEQLIARGQASGALRNDLDPRAVSCAMVAMLQGLVLQKLWTPDLGTEAVAQTCDKLIDSLGA